MAFTWAVLLGFIRIATNPAAFEQPLEVDEALDYVDGWLAQPVATIIHPTDSHAPTLRGLLEQLGGGGNLTSDAHLAALAIEHGAELCSSDNDFSRFEGLRWVNPGHVDDQVAFAKVAANPRGGKSRRPARMGQAGSQ